MERMTALARGMTVERQERLNDDAEPHAMVTRPVARSQDEARARLVAKIFSELSHAPSWNTASQSLRWHVAEAAVSKVFGDPAEMNRAQRVLEKLITISALVDAESGAEMLPGLPDQKRPMPTSTAYSGGPSSTSASSSTMSMSDFESAIYAFGSGAPSTEMLHALRSTTQDRTLEAVEVVEKLLDTAASMPVHYGAEDMRLLGTLSTMHKSVFELTFVSKEAVDALQACHRRFDDAGIKLGRQGTPGHIDFSNRIGQAIQILRKNSERYENFRQSDVASDAGFDDYPIWALVLYAEGLQEQEATLPDETLKMQTASEAEPSDDEGGSQNVLSRDMQDPRPMDQPPDVPEGGESQPGKGKRHRNKPPRGALLGTSSLNLKGDSKAGTGKIKRSGISHHHMGADKSLKKALRDLAGRRGKKWNHQMAVRTYKKG
jgi:hypothetical protein